MKELTVGKVVQLDKRDAKLAMAFMHVAFIALLIGGLCGLLQVLERAGIITLPLGIGYYQLLTAHGVLLALVFTTYFIYGFLFAGLSKTMGTFKDNVRKIAWIGYWVLTLGTLLAAILIILGRANVLYTFYAPLQADPFFYVGLTLFVVGNWIGGVAMLMHYFGWKKEHPGELTPLFGFMTTATIILWFIATIGVAITVLFQIIPWAFGLTDRINIMLSRTLFWYFGHPLVYFWLLPAYIAWYIVIPKVIGGKLFSDSLARLAFVLFLLFSFPVGFHHQLMEPGIADFWKYIQVILTFAVVVPSFLTAFSVFATFEIAGRLKGANGIFGWVKKLPWGDVRFLAPMMGALLFIPAGAGGIINASLQMNALVHNTVWIPGHFHLSVAGACALTFFGVAYWLIPYLTGRTLTKGMNRSGVIQTLLWTFGMIIMSTALHIMGLMGAPRRTAFTTYNDHSTALEWFNTPIGNHFVAALGGTLLFVSIIMMFVNFINLAFYAPKTAETEFPVSEVSEDAATTPAILENWKVWIGITVGLILFAYTIPMIDILQNSPPGSPVYDYLIK